MNDTPSRSAATDPSGRLLELDAPGARPVWAVLDAAGARRFTGELTLGCRPVVCAYFNDGEVYYAERDGDPTIGDRLVEYGVVTPNELVAGTVQLGKVAHLGRLFERVPTLDRDSVELVVEVVTGELLGEIADHTVESIAIASYKHHSSGIAKWRHRAGSDAPMTGEVPVIGAATGEVAVIAPPAVHRAEQIDHEATAADHQMVADYEHLMAAAAVDPVAMDEPTQQMEVPEALRILESPTYPPPSRLMARPQPVAVVPVAEPQPIAAVENLVEPPIAELDEITWLPTDEETEPEVQPATELEPAFEHVAESHDDVVTSTPFSFEFDLDKVLAQVACENDGLPFAADSSDDDVDEDVRAAVRQALVEIEAAMRPAITEGLSAVAFALALESAPDSPADIEPGSHLESRQDERLPVLKQPGDRPTIDSDPDDAEADDPANGELAASGTPGLTVRRLMGGARKP